MSAAGSQPSTSTSDSKVPDTKPTTLNVDDFFVMKACSECKLIARNSSALSGPVRPGIGEPVRKFSLFSYRFTEPVRTFLLPTPSLQA